MYNISVGGITIWLLHGGKFDTEKEEEDLENLSEYYKHFRSWMEFGLESRKL